MGQQTINQDAITVANQLAAWASQLEQLLQSGRVLSTTVTQGNLQGTWNAMATYTLNADGTQPGSNDATPNTTHPINGLNISANQLQGLSFMVNDFITFMTSTTTSPPQQNREATITVDLP